MLNDFFRVPRRLRYSFMDSELLSSSPNVNLRSTCIVLPVPLRGNVVDTDSSIPKRRYDLRRNKFLQRWHSTLPLVVWEDALVLWWDILWIRSKSTFRRKIIEIPDSKAPGIASDRYWRENRCRVCIAA